MIAHIKNPSLQTLIKGLISYEMLTYVFFGIGTAIVDYLVFTFFNAGKVSALIANVIVRENCKCKWNAVHFAFLFVN